VLEGGTSIGWRRLWPVSLVRAGRSLWVSGGGVRGRVGVVSGTLLGPEGSGPSSAPAVACLFPGWGGGVLGGVWVVVAGFSCGVGPAGSRVVGSGVLVGCRLCVEN